MIIHPTVFVLGAGASCSYGFPTGEGLRQQICMDDTNKSWLATNLKQKFEIDEDETINFVRHFKRSEVTTIDKFLSRSPHFSGIGKCSISMILCQAERPQKFDSHIKDHWYRELWNTMITDAHEFKELRENKIKFVTFNYDRSLEYYLYLSAKHLYGLGDGQALQWLSSIPIIHVYGQLGKFHILNDKSNRSYHENFTPESLGVAASGIKIIQEGNKHDDSFKQARIWFEAAERICFLGFGFDSLNIERLGLKEVLDVKKEKGMPTTIIASAFQKNSVEVTRYKSMVCPNDDWYVTHNENLVTIRETNLFY